MVEFVFPSTRKGWISGVRGTVAGARKWSETHVSSSGGGGHVHPTYGGHVSGTKVSSRVVERGEVWIRSGTGKEVQVPLNLPMNDGHEVIVLWGNIEGIKTGGYMYWRNFTSERQGYLQGMDQNLLVTPKEQTLRSLTWLGWWAAIAAAALVFVSPDGGGLLSKSTVLDLCGLAWLAASGFLLFAAPPKAQRYAKLMEDLEQLAARTDLAFNG